MNRLFLFTLILILLSACSPAFAQAGASVNVRPSPVLPQPEDTPTVQPIPISNSTIAPTFIASTAVIVTVPVEATLPSPTPTWVVQGPGKIICPILLYHHIAAPEKKSPYFVTSGEFQAQMQALKNWGYTSISPSLLIKAINFGAELPARPVIITFDDGYETVYTEAFPVLQEYGFTGTNYIVANYIGSKGFMSVDQLKELAAAGWETGSHSMTHADLTASELTEWEVVQSRASLEKKLGISVETFAYPYGQKNENALQLVRDNYRAAMGLGASLSQGPNNIFYLWRRPVNLGWDVQTFGSFLPWNTPIEH